MLNVIFQIKKQTNSSLQITLGLENHFCDQRRANTTARTAQIVLDFIGKIDNYISIYIYIYINGLSKLYSTQSFKLSTQ